jgi:general transcriptional corepressor TUP1
VYAGHERDIYALDFAKNGRFIASGSGDKSVRLWDVEAGQLTLQLNTEDGVTAVAISPDGLYVAAASVDRSVWVWDSVSGDLVQRFEGPEGHRNGVYSVAFSPTSHGLVSSDLDGLVKLWEWAPQRSIPPSSTPNGGKCIKTFEGHKVYIIPMLFYVCMLIQT